MAKPYPTPGFFTSESQVNPDIINQGDNAGRRISMKSKIKTIFTLFIVVLLLTIIPGCSSQKTTTTTTSAPTPTPTTPTATTPAPVSPFTDEELRQIVSDSADAMSAATAYKMGLDVTTSVTIDGKSTGSQVIRGNISTDQIQNQILMDAQVTTDDGKSSQQTQAFSVYILTDYVYMKATVPDAGEQWIKTAATPEVISTFDAGMGKEVLGVLQSPASVQWAGIASVNTIDCYVLKIVPNETYLKNYAQGQSPDTIDWTKVNDINSLFKEMWFQVSIAKDTKLVQKITSRSVLQLSKDLMTSVSSKYNKMVTNATGTIEMKDFNVPLVINLPAEAQKAVEISPDILLGK
jgi:hypothetical protein